MKLYFEIKEGQEKSFEKFCKANNFISLYCEPGFYCLDNSPEENCLINMDPQDIPKGCLLSWDYDYITKMYKNEIIGRFNQGKLQWTLMDFKAMEPLIEVMMYGMKKYDRGNWQKACPKRLDLLDSLERHYIKLVAGESIDPESGLPHIGHLMCNAMFYSYWEQKTNGQFENYIDIDQPF